MRRFNQASSTRNSLLLGVVGLLVIALPMVFGFASPVRGQVQSQSQGTSATAPPPAYGYDVVSIKPIAPGDVRNGIGILYAPDGLTARSVRVGALIRDAYDVQLVQISGAPKWFDTERYHVDARMDASAADSLQKLRPPDQILARQQMLQALLADRFKLTVHHETREIPVYFLMVSKNGPKLQEAKPDYVGPNDMADFEGNRATDIVSITVGGQFTGQAVSMKNLTGTLSAQLGRPVLDKTGLTGKYDFTFKYASDVIRRTPSTGNGASNQTLPAPPDPSGAPTLTKAIEDYLGLKLESGKGPVEIIVIDHVEKPSGN